MDSLAHCAVHFHPYFLRNRSAGLYAGAIAGILNSGSASFSGIFQKQDFSSNYKERNRLYDCEIFCNTVYRICRNSAVLFFLPVQEQPESVSNPVFILLHLYDPSDSPGGDDRRNQLLLIPSAPSAWAGNGNLPKAGACAPSSAFFRL